MTPRRPDHGWTGTGACLVTSPFASSTIIGRSDNHSTCQSIGRCLTNPPHPKDNEEVVTLRPVGLWRSWERASMAWKRSSVRSRPGPPNNSLQIRILHQTIQNRPGVIWRQLRVSAHELTARFSRADWPGWGALRPLPRAAYLANALEDPQERAETLRRAWQFAGRLFIVAAGGRFDTVSQLVDA